MPNPVQESIILTFMCLLLSSNKLTAAGDRSFVREERGP
jgi:hypothetical protein